MAYDQAKADRICELLADGTPLREICRMEGMPSWRTVYYWSDADEEFASRIAHARARGYDAIAEDILVIADDARNDFVAQLAAEGDEAAIGAKFNGEHVQRSKLRIETRLKLLAKWSPAKYGDKVTTEHTGPGGGPVQIIATQHDENL